MEKWRSELYHHGIKGQRWGVRRFQNYDGSYTRAGRIRYDDDINTNAVSKSRIGSQENTPAMRGKKLVESGYKAKSPYRIIGELWVRQIGASAVGSVISLTGVKSGNKFVSNLGAATVLGLTALNIGKAVSDESKRNQVEEYRKHINK